MPMTREQFITESEALGHAIQTGIKIKLAFEVATTPSVSVTSPQVFEALKHIRVGIDTAKAEIGALSKLLVKKGLISNDEVHESILEAYRIEVAMYERTCSELLGKRVTLG
jgi:hypothetical protein